MNPGRGTRPLEYEAEVHAYVSSPERSPPSLPHGDKQYKLEAKSSVLLFLKIYLYFGVCVCIHSYLHAVLSKTKRRWQVP